MSSQRQHHEQCPGPRATVFFANVINQSRVAQDFNILCDSAMSEKLRAMGKLFWMAPRLLMSGSSAKATINSWPPPFCKRVCNTFPPESSRNQRRSAATARNNVICKVRAPVRDRFAKGHKSWWPMVSNARLYWCCCSCVLEMVFVGWCLGEVLEERCRGSVVERCWKSAAEKW